MQWSNHVTPSPSQTSRPLPEVVHVDFKAFFASERTFIQWLHISITIGAIALSLSTLADSEDVRLAGVLLIGPSLFFTVYGVLSFYRRKSALERGSADALDDRLGPTLLAVVMIGVVGANLIVSLRRAWLRVEQPVGDVEDPYAT